MLRCRTPRLAGLTVSDNLRRSKVTLPCKQRVFWCHGRALPTKVHRINVGMVSETFQISNGIRILNKDGSVGSRSGRVLVHHRLSNKRSDLMCLQLVNCVRYRVSSNTDIRAVLGSLHLWPCIVPMRSTRFRRKPIPCSSQYQCHP